MEKCIETYGIGIEVMCPKCEFGTWVYDALSKHQNCNYCGCEFTLSKDIITKFEILEGTWGSL